MECNDVRYTVTGHIFFNRGRQAAAALRMWLTESLYLNYLTCVTCPKDTYKYSLVNVQYIRKTKYSYFLIIIYGHDIYDIHISICYYYNNVAVLDVNAEKREPFGSRNIIGLRVPSGSR